MLLKFLKKIAVKKTIAVITTACFALSIISANGLAAPAGAAMPAQMSMPAANYVVPFNLGKVTDSVNFSSEKAIVQIQDLHAHAQTQYNISSILNLLDKKYNIGNVYIEGAAAGSLDLNWLTQMPEALREKVVSSLINSGQMTGAEYWALGGGKGIKGIENAKIYFDNYKRLAEINAVQPQVETLIAAMKGMSAVVLQKHSSPDNLKLNALVNAYKAENITANKYFTTLFKYAKKYNVNFNDYPQLVMFAKILSLSRTINQQKVSAEIAEFLAQLKDTLSFSDYKTLLDLSAGKETEGEFYLALSRYYAAENGKYPELKKFFAFISLNQTVNPVELIKNDAALVNEIRYKASASVLERDAIFLSKFVELAEVFFTNKATAAQYTDFTDNVERFKQLWAVYTYGEVPASFNEYATLLDTFYKTNKERDRYFVKAVDGILPAQAKDAVRFFEAGNPQDILSGAKTVDVIITGGFHTNNLTKILKDKRQSYVVITPNVTQDVAKSEADYNRIVARQLSVFGEAFQVALNLFEGATFANADQALNSLTAIRELSPEALEVMSSLNSSEIASILSDVLQSKKTIKTEDGSTVKLTGVTGVVENETNYEITLTADVNGKAITRKNTIDKPAKETSAPLNYDDGIGWMIGVGTIITTIMMSQFIVPISLLLTFVVAGSVITYAVQMIGISKKVEKAIQERGKFSLKNPSAVAEYIRIVYGIDRNIEIKDDRDSGVIANYKDNTLNLDLAAFNVLMQENSSIAAAVIKHELLHAKNAKRVPAALQEAIAYFGMPFWQMSNVISRLFIGKAPFSSRFYELKKERDDLKQFKEDIATGNVVGTPNTEDVSADLDKFKKYLKYSRSYQSAEETGEIVELITQTEKLIQYFQDAETGLPFGYVSQSAERIDFDNKYEASSIYNRILNIKEGKYKINGKTLKLDASLKGKYNEILSYLLAKGNEGKHAYFRQFDDTDENGKFVIDDEKMLTMLDSVASANMNGRNPAEYLSQVEVAHTKSVSIENISPAKDVTIVNDLNNKEYKEAERKGIKAFVKTAVIQPLGGKGERLGFNWIKSNIVDRFLTNETYLQRNIREQEEMHKLGLQLMAEDGEVITEADKTASRVIMTSLGTHGDIVSELEKMGYKETPVKRVDGIVFMHFVNEDKVLKDIYLFRQEDVPTVNGKYEFTFKENGELEKKPHGHGDLIELLYRTGTLDMLEKQGKANTFFMQDSSPVAMNAAPALLAQLADGKKLSIATVQRDPNSKTGAIVEAVKDDKVVVGNLEYHVIGGFLIEKETKMLEAEVSDETKKKIDKEIKNIESNPPQDPNFDIIKKRIELLEAEVSDETKKEIDGEIKEIESNPPKDPNFDIRKKRIELLEAEVSDETKKEIDEKIKEIESNPPKDPNFDIRKKRIELLKAEVSDETKQKIAARMEQIVSSLYDANLNVFAVDIATMKDALQKTNGILPETINIKDGKTGRPETMMQDIMLVINALDENGKSQVATVRFTGDGGPRTQQLIEDLKEQYKVNPSPLIKAKIDYLTDILNPFVFQAAKNGMFIDGTLAGKMTETPTLAQENYYAIDRLLLFEAGVDIDVFGKTFYETHGEHFLGSEKLDFHYGVPVAVNNRGTLAEFFGRFSGENEISGDNTALIMSGNVGMDGFSLNGALNITAADGVNVVLSGAVNNKGVERSFMSLDEVKKDIGSKDIETVQAAMRAEKFKVNEELNITFETPGTYKAVFSDGEIIVTRQEDGKTAKYQITDKPIVVKMDEIAQGADTSARIKILKEEYRNIAIEQLAIQEAKAREIAKETAKEHNRPLAEVEAETDWSMFKPTSTFGSYYIGLMEQLALDEKSTSPSMSTEKGITEEEAMSSSANFFASTLSEWISKKMGVTDAKELYGLLGSKYDTLLILLNDSMNGGIGAGYTRYEYVPNSEAYKSAFDEAVEKDNYELVEILNAIRIDGTMFGREINNEKYDKYKDVIEKIVNATEGKLGSKAEDIVTMLPFVRLNADGEPYRKKDGKFYERPVSIAEKELIRNVLDSVDGKLPFFQFISLIAAGDQNVVKTLYEKPIAVDVIRAVLMTRGETPQQIEEKLAKLTVDGKPKTFQQYFREVNGDVFVFDGVDETMTFLTQFGMPNVYQDEKTGEIEIQKKINFNGHGFRPIQIFEYLLKHAEAYKAVQELFQDTEDGITQGRVIAMFNNSDGENNGSYLSRLFNIMLNLIEEKEGKGKGPIMVVESTTATSLDAKGGKIGLKKNIEEAVRNSLSKIFKGSIGIVEVAQMKVQGKAAAETFAKIGVSIGEFIQFFNTNNMAIDVNRLTPFFMELAAVYGNVNDNDTDEVKLNKINEGLSKLYKEMTPDLIRKDNLHTINPKKEIFGDAIEGAAASSVFNINAFFENERLKNDTVAEIMDKYLGNHPFVELINLPVELRSIDFTGRKSILDEAFLERKGIYELDPKTLNKIKNRPMTDEEFEQFKETEEYKTQYAELKQAVAALKIRGIKDYDTNRTFEEAIEQKWFWEGRYQIPKIVNAQEVTEEKAGQTVTRQVFYNDIVVKKVADKEIKMDAKKIMALFGDSDNRHLIEEELINKEVHDEKGNVKRGLLGYYGIRTVGHLRVVNESDKEVIITPELLEQAGYSFPRDTSGRMLLVNIEIVIDAFGNIVVDDVNTHKPIKTDNEISADKLEAKTPLAQTVQTRTITMGNTSADITINGSKDLNNLDMLDIIFGKESADYRDKITIGDGAKINVTSNTRLRKSTIAGTVNVERADGVNMVISKVNIPYGMTLNVDISTPGNYIIEQTGPETFVVTLTANGNRKQFNLSDGEVNIKVDELNPIEADVETKNSAQNSRIFDLNGVAEVVEKTGNFISAALAGLAQLGDRWKRSASKRQARINEATQLIYVDTYNGNDKELQQRINDYAEAGMKVAVIAKNIENANLLTNINSMTNEFMRAYNVNGAVVISVASTAGLDNYNDKVTEMLYGMDFFENSRSVAYEENDISGSIDTLKANRATPVNPTGSVEDNVNIALNAIKNIDRERKQDLNPAVMVDFSAQDLAANDASLKGEIKSYMQSNQAVTVPASLSAEDIMRVVRLVNEASIELSAGKKVNLRMDIIIKGSDEEIAKAFDSLGSDLENIRGFEATSITSIENVKALRSKLNTVRPDTYASVEVSNAAELRTAKGLGFITAESMLIDDIKHGHESLGADVLILVVTENYSLNNDEVAAFIRDLENSDAVSNASSLSVPHAVNRAIKDTGLEYNGMFKSFITYFRFKRKLVTPEQAFEAGRKLAAERNFTAKGSAADINKLYSMLAAMENITAREGEFLGEELKKLGADYDTYTKLMNIKFDLIRGSDDSKDDLLELKEKQGMLEQILINTERAAYVGDEDAYVVGSDSEVYANALFEARKLLVSQNEFNGKIDAKKPYIDQLLKFARSSKAGATEYSDGDLTVEDMLKHVAALNNGKIDVDADKLTIREYINRLNGLVKDPETSEADRALALATLINLLVVYAPKVELKDITKDVESGVKATMAIMKSA